MSTLIVPAAGKSSRFPNMKPKWLLTHPTGDLMIKKVLDSFEYYKYDRTIITILKEHCHKYDADIILNQIFDNNVEVLILDYPTDSAAETIVKTIQECDLSGRIIIKDSDCVVDPCFELVSTRNGIVGMQINSTSGVDKIQTKSFIVKNDDDIIMDIVEKEIVSNTICIGVYSIFVDDFMLAYREICDSYVYKKDNEIYVSHVISYLILQHNKIFNYIKSDKFVDWGTKQDWIKEQNKFKTYIFDIDGVLLMNYGKYGIKNWSNTFEPIQQNINLLKKLSDEGHQIIFMTARSNLDLKEFKQFMSDMDIQYKQIISDCFHGKRIIINDFANTNTYPSCQAVSIKRNDLLEDYIL